MAVLLATVTDWNRLLPQLASATVPLVVYYSRSPSWQNVKEILLWLGAKKITNRYLKVFPHLLRIQSSFSRPDTELVSGKWSPKWEANCNAGILCQRRNWKMRWSRYSKTIYLTILSSRTQQSESGFVSDKTLIFKQNPDSTSFLNDFDVVTICMAKWKELTAFKTLFLISTDPAMKIKHELKMTRYPNVHPISLQLWLFFVANSSI